MRVGSGLIFKTKEVTAPCPSICRTSSKRQSLDRSVLYGADFHPLRFTSARSTAAECKLESSPLRDALEGAAESRIAHQVLNGFDQ